MCSLNFSTSSVLLLSKELAYVCFDGKKSYRVIFMELHIEGYQALKRLATSQ